MAYRPAAVTDDLHFDVPRLIDKLLGVESIITKGRLGLRRTVLVSLSKLVSAANHTHTSTTAAGNRFELNTAVGVSGEKRFGPRQRQRLCRAG